MGEISLISWNVNSLRQRLENITALLADAQPDLLLLQETKIPDADFPAAVFKDLGYHTAILGQKSYNGVAICSRLPLHAVRSGLPGFADDQARYIEALAGEGAAALRTASIYVPNGNPKPGEKFAYKQAWLKAFAAHARTLLEEEKPLCLAGDYNIIPQTDDVWDGEAFADNALFDEDLRRLYATLLHDGFTDALALTHPAQKPYTFWDYQAGAWRKNHGMRIDHILLSPSGADRLVSCGVLKGQRGSEHPSDHAPIWARFKA